MAQIKETAVVYSQEMLAPDIYSMWIATKAAADAKPGQFISVYTKGWIQASAKAYQHL